MKKFYVIETFLQRWSTLKMFWKISQNLQKTFVVEKELHNRYFSVKIIAISSLEMQLSKLFWKVSTTISKAEFVFNKTKRVTFFKFLENCVRSIKFWVTWHISLMNK